MSSTPEPGWYPDPERSGADQLRWWDGQAWSAHVARPGGATTRRSTRPVALIVAGVAAVAVLAVGALVVLDRIGQQATRASVLPAQPAPTALAAPTVTGNPALVVVPGVNTISSSAFTPLFEVRGTGSRTSAPLTFSTVKLIGGVQNSGAVQVWIVPEGTAAAASRPYYTNGAGSGGAVATLPRTGRYVVVVRTTDPSVQWTVDIADQATR